MFLIFDLDDTLIETSKCLALPAMKRAFTAMLEEGLNLEESAFEDLLKINASSISSRASVQTFWEKHSNKKEILDAGLSALSSPFEDSISLEPVPDALEILEELQGVCPLALVTMGTPKLQRQKMKKAGIQLQRFSTLIVGRGPSKKKDYQRVALELGLPCEEGVVCGDRVPIDLSPAKELGFFTVHFPNGRGKVHGSPREDVDTTIHSLKELKRVIIGKKNEV